jgi:hypothetical protein
MGAQQHNKYCQVNYTNVPGLVRAVMRRLLAKYYCCGIENLYKPIMIHVPLVCCCVVLLCTLTLQAWVLKCLGADEVVDYTCQDFADLYSATDKQFDIVWDVLVGATAVAVSDMHACGKVAQHRLCYRHHRGASDAQPVASIQNIVHLDCLWCAVVVCQ